MAKAIILISGKQGSGKTTTADALMQRLNTPEARVYRTRFAKVLYEMHNAVRDIGRKYGLQLPDKNGYLLQIIGTEWGRNKIDNDVWVKTMEGDIAGFNNATGGADYVIVDDMRFKNEFTGLEQFAAANGYRLVRVRLIADRDTRKARCDGWRDTEDHSSETDLDDWADLGRFDLAIGTGATSSSVTTEQAVNMIVNFIDGVSAR